MNIIVFAKKKDAQVSHKQQVPCKVHLKALHHLICKGELLSSVCEIQVGEVIVGVLDIYRAASKLC